MAEAAGGDWPARIERAFAQLAQSDADDQGLGVMLLFDIREVFREIGADRIFSKELVDALCAKTNCPGREHAAVNPSLAGLADAAPQTVWH